MNIKKVALRGQAMRKQQMTTKACKNCYHYLPIDSSGSCLKLFQRVNKFFYCGYFKTKEEL